MDKTKELTRILCKWNRRELGAMDAVNKIWELYKKEARETWNDPLESLLVDSNALHKVGGLKDDFSKKP